MVCLDVNDEASGRVGKALREENAPVVKEVGDSRLVLINQTASDGNQL